MAFDSLEVTEGARHFSNSVDTLDTAYRYHVLKKQIFGG